MNDSEEAIAQDVAAVGRITAVPSLLRIVCQHTGMGFAAVARVTDDTWTACAVQDDIQFGLKPGAQLAIETTLCRESRAARAPVVIDDASLDPVYRDHHTPRIYNIQSYISVPIVRPGGDYFGNLCAIDPRPARLSEPRTVAMFTLFAELIGMQLEIEDRQQATETALLDARATAELREQFIAVLGHDLRNPLAAVGASAETLMRRRAEPDLQRMGQRLRSSVKRMSGLIYDVLDFARARLGSGIGVNLQKTADLAQALSDIVAELRAANTGRELLAHVDVPVPVVCDRGRLQQVLSNLLGNAFTYGSPAYPILVDASIDGDRLQLSVENQGEPIAPQDLRKVFEPYWRPATSKPGGGLGLGLHICSQIVKAHHGSLEVTSAGTSTRFVVRIPLSPPAAG